MNDTPLPPKGPRKSVARRLADGFAWSSLGAIAWRALTAISSVLVARILGPAGFGELGIVRSTANLFTVYAGFRLGTTANKYLAEYRETDPGKAARVLRMSLVMSAVFCALAAGVLLLGGGWIARHQLANPDLDLALRLAGVFLFFQAYATVRETILIGTENFKAFAKVNAVKGILTAVLIVPGAWAYGVNGAVGGLALAAIGSYLVLQHYVRQALESFAIDENQPFSAWKAELPVLWHYALPGLVVGGISAAMLWWGRTVLAETDGGYIQLGLFEAANQWRTMILFLPAILSRVAMPVLAETYGRDRKGDFARAVVLQFRAIVVLCLPLTVVVMVGSEWLMTIFGDAYADSGAILPLLMISVFLFALNQALRRVQDGSGKRWQNAALQVLWAIAFAVTLLGQERPVDAVTLAQAFAVSEAVMFVAQLLYIELAVTRGTVRGILGDMLAALLAVAAAVRAQYLGGLATWGGIGLVVAALLLSAVPAFSVGLAALGSRRRARRPDND